MKRRLLLAVLAFLGTLLALEAGARLFIDPVPPDAFPGISPSEIPDPTLLWRNRPGYAADDLNGPINALGFRGADTALEKPGGTLRILSLGESTTFGHGVRWDQTYSHLLQFYLRARGHDVEVINGGVRGWSTYQSFRFLEQEIDTVRPDLVLLYQEINDFLPTTFRGTVQRGEGLDDVQFSDLMEKRAWVYRIIRGSRLLTALQLSRARAKASRELRETAARKGRDVLVADYLPYTSIPFTPREADKPWMSNENVLVRLPDDERRATLEALLRLTRRKGVALVVIHPSYPVSKRHRCLLTELAEQQGLPWIDMEDVIADVAAAEGRSKIDYFLPGDSFHPNPVGHVRMARAIGDHLMAQGLLERP